MSSPSGSSAVPVSDTVSPSPTGFGDASAVTVGGLFGNTLMVTASGSDTRTVVVRHHEFEYQDCGVLGHGCP